MTKVNFSVFLYYNYVFKIHLIVFINTFVKKEYLYFCIDRAVIRNRHFRTENCLKKNKKINGVAPGDEARG